MMGLRVTDTDLPSKELPYEHKRLLSLDRPFWNPIGRSTMSALFQEVEGLLEEGVTFVENGPMSGL